MFIKSLSGRFLLLTIIFVMLAEVLIFVPSVARFRMDYLQARLERSQIASLALLATPDDMVGEALQAELLRNAGVLNIVLLRNEMRELILTMPMPAAIDKTFDLRESSAWDLMRDAMDTLINGGDRVIRVLGEPVKQAGLLIEVAMKEAPLKAAMIDYGQRIFLLSAAISVFTGALLFFAVRAFLVQPISRVVSQIRAYAAAPEDARRIIQPNAGVTELFEAEKALQSMQIQLSSSLRQKDRLAALGGAVSKISHDLRNILTTTQLLADRVEMSEDPGVKRTAPKLLNSLSRAVNLCERTLAYGKAEETSPEISRFPMRRLLEDVVESERLAIGEDPIEICLDMDADVEMSADQEQIFRVVSNLVRNARQVLSATKKPGEIRVEGAETPIGWRIRISDNGPGLPAKAMEHLFQPFQGGARQGGTGLGLAISSELVRGHGGTLELIETSAAGSCFEVCLPKEIPDSGASQ
jgi:signal transduction histidine kinase